MNPQLTDPERLLLNEADPSAIGWTNTPEREAELIAVFESIIASRVKEAREAALREALAAVRAGGVYELKNLIEDGETK